MPAIPPLIQFSPNTLAKSSDVNSNFGNITTSFNTYAALKDTPGTITATWTWTVNEVFSGGIAVSGAATFASGVTYSSNTTITASGVTVAGNPAFSGPVTIAGNVTLATALNVAGALTVSGASVLTGNVTCAAALNVAGAGSIANLTIPAGGNAPLRVFATLVVTGDVAASLPIAFNNAAATVNAVQIGITDTASAKGSRALTVVNGVSEIFRIPKEGGCVTQAVTLATSATVGFVYLPTMPATASGTPQAEPGCVPCVVDAANFRLNIFMGGVWKSVALT